jgi:hypothetical protein
MWSSREDQPFLRVNVYLTAIDKHKHQEIRQPDKGFKGQRQRSFSDQPKAIHSVSLPKKGEIKRKNYYDSLNQGL